MSNPWWMTDTYNDGVPLPHTFEDHAGPNGVLLVIAHDNGSTERGWGEKSFRTKYADNRPARNMLIEKSFRWGGFNFAIVMRSVQMICIDIDGKNGSGVGQWVNIGTSTSCKFVPFGPQSQYGFKMAGIFTTIGGDANESYIIPEARADDLSFVSYAVSDDNDTIAENIPTDGNLTFTASADPLTAHAIHFALVQSGVESTYGMVAAGKHIATGVANPRVITVTGALAGDIALVKFGAVNTGPRTISKAVVTANTLTVTLSGAPTVGDGINYVILRRRGGFKESHYIAYAGRITTVGGDATEVITVTGNEAINVPIVVYATSDDTDTITTVTSNADNITVVCSADPLTDHSFHYMSLKAY